MSQGTIDWPFKPTEFKAFDIIGETNHKVSSCYLLQENKRKNNSFNKISYNQNNKIPLSYVASNLNPLKLSSYNIILVIGDFIKIIIFPYIFLKQVP